MRTVVVHLRSWSPGGFCEDHWLPSWRLLAKVRQLQASGHRTQVIGRS